MVPEKHALEKYRRDLKAPWGLAQCTGVHRNKCEVCLRYGDDKQALSFMRNLFISCIPNEAIPIIMDKESTITGAAVATHAKRHGWAGKRMWQFNQTVLKHVALNMSLQRYLVAKDVISEQTGDKMIDNVMKLAGIGEKVKIEQSLSMSWEQTLTQASKDETKDAVFTLPDTDFTSLEPIEEGEDAAAD